MGPEEFSPAGIETVVLAKPVLPRGRVVDVLEPGRGAERARVVARVNEDGCETEVRVKDEPKD
jgi:DEAD/DEAH box helicase domain-containing protein